MMFISSILILISHIAATSAQMHLFVRTLQQLQHVEKRPDDHNFWGRYLQANSLSFPPAEGMGMMMIDGPMMMGMMMVDDQMRMGMGMEGDGAMGVDGAMGMDTEGGMGMGMDDGRGMGMAMGMDDEGAMGMGMDDAGAMGMGMGMDDAMGMGMEDAPPMGPMGIMMSMDDDYAAMGMMGMEDAPPMRPMGMDDNGVGSMGMGAALRHIRY